MDLRAPEPLTLARAFGDVVSSVNAVQAELGDRTARAQPRASPARHGLGRTPSPRPKLSRMFSPARLPPLFGYTADEGTAARRRRACRRRTTTGPLTACEFVRLRGRSPPAPLAGSTPSTDVERAGDRKGDSGERVGAGLNANPDVMRGIAAHHAHACGKRGIGVPCSHPRSAMPYSRPSQSSANAAYESSHATDRMTMRALDAALDAWPSDHRLRIT